jgi:hypothetical protein
MASMNKKPVPPATTSPAAGERAEREYGHSSGDRNTRTDEHDWQHFKDGKARTEHAGDGREPPDDPHRPT